MLKAPTAPPATAHAIADPDTGDLLGYYASGHIGFDAMARAVEFYDGTAIAPPPPGSRFAWTYFRRVDVADEGEPPRWELREARAGARGAEPVTVFEF